MKGEVPTDAELSVLSLKSDAAPSAGHLLVTGPVHRWSMPSANRVVSRLKCRVTAAWLFPVDGGQITVTEQCCTLSYTQSHLELGHKKKVSHVQKSLTRSSGILEYYLLSYIAQNIIYYCLLYTVIGYILTSCHLVFFMLVLSKTGADLSSLGLLSCVP